MFAVILARHSQTIFRRLIPSEKQTLWSQQNGGKYVFTKLFNRSHILLLDGKVVALFIESLFRKEIVTLLTASKYVAQFQDTNCGNCIKLCINVAI